LSQAIQIKKGSETDKAYGHCRDNTIASIGKIIKHQAENINLKEIIAAWISLLPLKYDKPEAKG